MKQLHYMTFQNFDVELYIHGLLYKLFFIIYKINQITIASFGNLLF